jgi:toxin-antitoxin system, toxin component, bro family
MKKLQIFSNNEFGEIRTLVLNNEPWFVGKDVAGILKYERPTKAVADHVDVEDRNEVPSSALYGLPYYKRLQVPSSS